MATKSLKKTAKPVKAVTKTITKSSVKVTKSVKREIPENATIRSARVLLADVKPEKVKAFKDGYYLVDPAKTGGRLEMHSVRTVPGTYIVVNRKTKEASSLVTIMPDSLHVAWDSCGVCHQWFTLCRCKGIQVARSVEHIYDATVARLAGEEFDYKHPDYLGSTTRRYRETVQARSTIVGTGYRPGTGPDASKALRTASSALPGGTGDGPKRLKKVKAAAPVVDITDQRAIDEAAATTADDLTKQFTKAAKKVAKPKPKQEAPKRLLKKKR